MLTDKELQKQRSDDNKINIALAGLILTMWDAAIKKDSKTMEAAFAVAGQIFVAQLGYVERLRERVKARGIEEKKKQELVKP